MEIAAVIIFILVYLGMMLGFWPGLALDRTGIALLGAIAFIELQNISVTEAASYIDFPSLCILFSLMIVSAQFYYSGFYTRLVERMGEWELSPSLFLLVVILISAVLSSILINDIVCLALTPLIIKVCFHKKLNPIPYLLGLACASNIGSALTLVGNPQNLLIGQVLNIPFMEYLQFSFLPCVLGLVVTWLIIKYQVKEDWFEERDEINPEVMPFNLWQSIKGIGVIIVLLAVFLFTDFPRDKVSLIAAGVLLLSRHTASQKLLSFIDWQLLVLFIGLFIVNRSFLNIFDASTFAATLNNFSIDLHSPMWLASISLIFSNFVSNVPAVMLLLPFISNEFEGSVLALSSTLAGNLFIVGSIANIIVISQAAKYGIKIDWKKHMRVGLPVTVVTFLIALAWIQLMA